MSKSKKRTAPKQPVAVKRKVADPPKKGNGPPRDFTPSEQVIKALEEKRDRLRAAAKNPPKHIDRFHNG